MHAKLTLILAAVSACVFSEALSAPPKPLAPLGVGFDSCREWLAHHDANDRQAEIQDQWLAGFITGYNAFADPRHRGMSFFRFDLATLPSGVTARCRALPETDVYSAAQAFLKGLRTQVRPRGSGQSKSPLSREHP